MSNDKYSLLKYIETNEYHLYESQEKSDGGCSLKENIPLCGDKDVTPDKKSGLFVCYSEKDARTWCADLANKGKEICGRCVSSLYATKS